MSGGLRAAAGVVGTVGLALLTAISCGDRGEEQIAPEPDVPYVTPGNLPDDPPHAQRFRLDMLREGRDTQHSPSDGGGRAWIEGEARAGAGAPGRWTIVYEAGEEGIAEGGYVRLTVSPFWNWSDPQDYSPDSPGYTTAVTEAEGLDLTTLVPDRGVFIVVIEERDLASGEQVRLVYGAGDALARADKYAERESPFWISVDGDGDGFAVLIDESPTVTVDPGPAARLVVTLPSTAAPGEAVPMHLALVDRYGNAGVEFIGTVDFPGMTEGLSAPERVEFTPEELGRKTIEVRAETAGVHRVLARALPDDAPEGFEGWTTSSNPIEVSSGGARVFWADLHGHTNLTDGTGTPEDYFVYARDVAGLDIVSLTDHDHWGMRKIDANPDMWARITAATLDAHEPGSFVTLLGYEWTSWIHGHRHVVYFEDEGEVFSAVDEAYESPLQLWAALRTQGVPALTFAHHSAGGPIACNWDIPPDPELEPVTEIMSVHGSSEAYDSPSRIYSPVEGNFVRDVLDRGYRLGFLASGDSHDGHPGLAGLASPNSGLAAVLADDLTRESVLDALRQRRCYATSGARILLRAALAGHPMGETLAAPPDGEAALLYVHVMGTAPLVAIHVIRSGEVVSELDPEGAWDFTAGIDIEDLRSGEYLYVRVVQEDRGLAWSSPFYVD